MLLTRLQRQRETRVTRRIHGTPDDAPGHLAHVRLPATHESEVRSAGGQRCSERLPFADNDVRTRITPLARWRQQCQRNGVYHCDHERVVPMRPVGKLVDILQHTEEIRLWDHKRGKVSALVRFEGIENSVAALLGERHTQQLDVLIRDDAVRYLTVNRVHRRRNQHPARLPMRTHSH